jgi:hypothetical protein
MGATGNGRSWRDSVRLISLLAMLIAVLAALPGSRAGAAPKAPPGDPPGNNGTVKIDQSDVPDDDKGNEPIGDNCLFWLKFYNFDKDQTADVSFVAHPPTAGKDPLVDKNVLISDDPAGGGQDEDAVISYDLTSYFDGIKPHPQHGYHVKLTVTVKNADGSAVPGGVKHKVFWIKCTPAPATTLRISKALEGTGAGPFAFSVSCNHRPLDTTFTLAAGEKHDVTGVPPGTTCVATETDSKGATSSKVSENPPDDAADGKVKVAAGKPETVTFTNVFPGSGTTPPPSDSDLRGPSGGPSQAGETGGPGTPAAAPGATVLGENLSKPATAPLTLQTLPRTGAEPRPLTATGLWSLTAGGLALAAGRARRRR